MRPRTGQQRNAASTTPLPVPSTFTSSAPEKSSVSAPCRDLQPRAAVYRFRPMATGFCIRRRMTRRAILCSPVLSSNLGHCETIASLAVALGVLGKTIGFYSAGSSEQLLSRFWNGAREQPGGYLVALQLPHNGVS